METSKSIPVRIRENSKRRWCGVCGELVISEFATFVQGTSLVDHACFKDAEAFKTDGQYIYKDSHAEQPTVQHPVVLENISPNLTANNGLRRLNIIPMNMKQVLGAFNNKPRTSTNNLIIAKNTNSNDAQHQLPGKPDLRAHSIPSQHSSPNIDDFLSNHSDGLERSLSNVIQRQSVEIDPLQYELLGYNIPAANDIQGASDKNSASVSSYTNESSSCESFDSVFPRVPILQITGDKTVSEISHQGSPNSPQDMAGTKNVKEDTSPGGFRWKEPMVKLLLESYTRHKKLHDKGVYLTKKKLYEKISEDLMAHNYKYITVDQIASKVKRLQDDYKEKVSNMGSKESGAGRKDVAHEDELVDAFGKKHSIHPPCLIGANFEYTKEDNNMPQEDLKNEMTKGKSGVNNKRRVNDVSNNIDGKQENNDDRPSKSCASKKKKYVMNVTPSGNSIKEKHHLENLERKDTYIELKEKELDLEAKNKKEELEIRQQTQREFFEIQKMKLALEAKKLQAQYPNSQFDITNEQ
ncbi:hypothetical protein QAD02_018438 [Eretmocerus hayati]|uniref:Uncharacterized protein n=1 Tax=Eretmocerus hayati TaxID=131215 RepID=A0ACC2PIJ8_9HYME|nr:hypothetical protein QAD02_018438 [Eretmocerus hayati]